MADISSPFTHILVPTDGSHPSMQAGRLAVQLAACQNAQVTFLYVVDQSVASELAGATGRNLQQVQSEMDNTAQRSLDYLTRLASEMGVNSSQEIRHGVPSNEIATLAREQNIDLIAIGQIGSRGPRHFLIGSVTERIIEHSPCPVLVVK
jgi:nucleotide-binding universal stress UspA family protein